MWCFCSGRAAEVGAELWGVDTLPAGGGCCHLDGPFVRLDRLMRSGSPEVGSWGATGGNENSSEPGGTWQGCSEQDLSLGLRRCLEKRRLVHRVL